MRCQVVYADGTVDRSPSGDGLAALVAVIAAMGLDAGEPLVVESVAGTALTGRVVDHVAAAERIGVRVEVSGRAWVIAEHAFVIDPEDPLRDGMEW